MKIVSIPVLRMRTHSKYRCIQYHDKSIGPLSMFILFYLISNTWSAISAISNCKTLFPQSNKNPYHAKNTLLYNFYAIHYVSILLCQAIPLARLLLLLNAKKSKFIFFVINRGSRGTTLFSPGVFIHVKTHNYLKG